MNGIPFSHSSLKSFETCAAKHHAEKVIKLYPFTDSVYTIYGKELHKAAEEYVKDDAPIPAKFGFMKELLDTLKAKPGRKFCEHEMGVTKELKPTGFKAEDVWCRGIADLLIVDDDSLTATVVDYKSGSDKYPDKDQLVLMALLVFAHFPHIRLVKGGLLFVVKDTMVKHKVELAQAQDHWQDYRERVGRLEEAFATGVWRPKPSGLCRRHCPVETCPYHGG